MSTEGSLGDLTREFNVIETQIYAVEPQTGEYPTLRVNSSKRPGYNAGNYSFGTSLNLEGPAFRIQFEPEEEFPDSDFGYVDAIMESDHGEHQEYGGKPAHVKMYPDFMMDPAVQVGDEVTDGFDPDGTAHVESNDEFEFH